MTERVYIGLGSNLGERERHLLDALEALRRIDAVAVTRCSSLYESAPFGPPQPRYLNAVAELECGLRPQQLLPILQTLEDEFGRERRVRWGPRTLDLDIVFWEGQVVADPNLQVPHLDLHNRRFVLEPLAELAPKLVHPLLGETVECLREKVRAQDVHRVGTLVGAHVAPVPHRSVESR